MSCMNPDCDEPAEERFVDGRGNAIKLCTGCYFREVTNRRTVSYVDRRKDRDTFLDKIRGKTDE